MLDGLLLLISIYGVYALTIVVALLFFTAGQVLQFIAGYTALCTCIAIVRYPALRAELRRVEVRGRAGYLYGFFDRGNLLPAVKIGRESERYARLKQHRTAAPLGINVFFSIAVPDAVAAEAVLHRRYAASRLSPRNEWFMYTPVMFFELVLIRYIGA